MAWALRSEPGRRHLVILKEGSHHLDAAIHSWLHYRTMQGWGQIDHDQLFEKIVCILLTANTDEM